MPDWKPEIEQRLNPQKLPPLREASIVEEISTYLDDCYSELLASGATPGEAYRQALRQLGSSEVLTRELNRITQETESSPLPGTNRRTNMLADLWHE
jgi:hypothetical protein